MDLQDKILNKLQEITERNNLEFIHNRAFSNTGIVLIMCDMDVHLSFTYNFQGRYFTMQFYPGDKEPVSTVPLTHPDCIRSEMIYINEMEKFKVMASWYENYLRQLKISA